MMKKIILFLLFVFAFVPSAFAATSLELGSVGGDDYIGTDGANQIVPECRGENGNGECGWEDLVELAKRILNFVVYFSGILAVMAFCYAGFLYMTAFGNMGKVEEAHKIFGSAIIGVFFILAGWLIVATILKILVGDKDEAGIETIIDFKGVKTIQGQ